MSNIHTKPKMKQSQYVIFAVQMPFVFYLYGIWLEHRRLPRAHWQHCAEELRPGPRQPPEDVLGSKQHRARSLSPWAALICSPRLCFFGLRAMFSIEGEEIFKTRSEPRPRTGRLGAGAGPGPPHLRGPRAAAGSGPGAGGQEGAGRGHAQCGRPLTPLSYAKYVRGGSAEAAGGAEPETRRHGAARPGAVGAAAAPPGGRRQPHAAGQRALRAGRHGRAAPQDPLQAPRQEVPARGGGRRAPPRRDLRPAG